MVILGIDPGLARVRCGVIAMDSEWDRSQRERMLQIALAGHGHTLAAALTGWFQR